jgi:hypothetical protein
MIMMILITIQFNSIYLCAKLNSPVANYKVSTGKKMRRVRSKKVSESNNLIKLKIIKYKMTMLMLITIIIIKLLKCYGKKRPSSRIIRITRMMHLEV